jgi:hypothetical protein
LRPQPAEPSSAQARAASDDSAPAVAAAAGCISILPGSEAATRAAFPASTICRTAPSGVPTSTLPSVTETSAPLPSAVTVKTVPLTSATR